MKTVTYEDAEADFGSVFVEVCESGEPVQISLEDNRDIVVLPLADYISFDENGYLLGSPRNAQRLREAIVLLEIDVE